MIKIINNTVKKVKIIAVVCAVFFYGCDDMLNKYPLGSLSESVFTTKEAIDKLLVACYSPLSGMIGGGQGNAGGWQSSPDNMYYGDMGPGNMHKGSTPGDQPTLLAQERFVVTSDNMGVALTKWTVMYAAIDRCNDVLRTLDDVEVGDLSNSDELSIRAEARFLRAYYHSEVKKLWNMVPFIDETVTDLQRRVPNNRDIWPDIEADLSFAVSNLPPSQQAEPGRPTSWAAKAFLAKTYLFQQKYAEAKPLLDDIINNGPYRLNDNFFDNFNAENNNGIESVWQSQVAVNVPGASYHRSQRGGDLAHPNAPTDPRVSGAGFNQPTFDLVNAYKTSVDGLPLFDSYFDEDFKHDMGIASDEAYSPDMTTPVDPRLDWTVGRRGVPYHDWGIHTGRAWIRDQASAGPYNQKKHVILRSQLDRYGHESQAKFNAMNFNIIRYAQVLLWAAECEVEIGDPEKARTYVNMIRARARDGIYVRLGDDAPFGDGPAAANYVVDEYKDSWAGRDKDWLRRRVWFEHRLEFALEGHYMFDLIRWNADVEYINAYIAREKTHIEYMNDVVYTTNKRYLPIPLQQIDRSYVDGQPTLTQNNY